MIIVQNEEFEFFYRSSFSFYFLDAMNFLISIHSTYIFNYEILLKMFYMHLNLDTIVMYRLKNVLFSQKSHLKVSDLIDADGLYRNKEKLFKKVTLNTRFFFKKLVLPSSLNVS